MNFIVCANYLFISVVSVQLSGYAQYKVSIKKKKNEKMNQLQQYLHILVLCFTKFSTGSACKYC